MPALQAPPSQLNLPVLLSEICTKKGLWTLPDELPISPAPHPSLPFEKHPAALGMIWLRLSGKSIVEDQPILRSGLEGWHIPKIHWYLIQPVAKSLHPAFSWNCAPWMRDCRKSSRFVVSCFGPTSINMDQPCDHATYIHIISYHIHLWLNIPPLESTCFPWSLRSLKWQQWHLLFLCRLFSPTHWMEMHGKCMVMPPALNPCIFCSALGPRTKCHWRLARGRKVFIRDQPVR